MLYDPVSSITDKAYPSTSKLESHMLLLLNTFFSAYN